MKVNLKNLKNRPRESEDFYFKEKGRDSFLEDMDAGFLDAVEVEMLVENTGRLFIGKGRIKTTVELPCSRCLEKVKYPVDTEFDCTLLEEYLSDNEEDEDIIVFNDDEVDIWPCVEEAILMAFPITILCSKDCKGLCPVCGINKNMGNCSCEQEAIDPRWEKLKNLR